MESENPFLLENAMNEWSSQGMHDSRADSVSDSVPYRPSSSLSSSSHHRYYHSTYDQLGPFDYSESTFLSAISDPSAHQRMEDSPRLVMHFLKQGLEQVHNSTIRPMMENGVIQLNALSQQHRQQQQHDQFTSIPPLTELANIEANNVNMSGNNSVNQFDESVFSLLTIRNALIITFYSLIIVVSLTGNLLVCKVAFGSREMRTTTNLLIASLACSDIVMTVFNIPFNVVRILPISWPFGDLVCVLVPLIQTSCVYVSTFTMTLIALHRFWTIRQRRTSVSKTSDVKVALTILTIWLIALTLSLPHAAFNRVKEKRFNGRVLNRCMVNFPKVEFNFQLLLTVEVLITQYLLPLSITLVVYVKIARVIARQGQLICKLSDEKKRRQSEAKRKRIFMLALAVATFATCWAPIDVYLLLVDLHLVSLQTDVFILCHWFAMSSVCYNPIIYCWLNEKFRNGAKQTIRIVLRFTHLPLLNKQDNLTQTTILTL